MSRQQRQYFRIEYPVAERPSLIMAQGTFDVIDTSERGMRFIPNAQFVPTDGQWPEIRGKLRFRDGSECEVAGKVVRQSEDGSLVVQLSLGISLALIMKEQRRLIQKYRVS